MVNMVKVFGTDEIKKAMKKANKKLGHSARKGLIKGGLLLQRESQKVVPVEFGVLKNSAGTEAIGHGWYTDVVVFYTASYAVYVHEITYRGRGLTSMKKVRHKPGKISKFLETPARRHKDRILRAIAGEMRKT
jgi:hypothetical protein